MDQSTVITVANATSKWRRYFIHTTDERRSIDCL